MHIIYYDLDTKSLSAQLIMSFRSAKRLIADIREKQRVASAQSEIYFSYSLLQLFCGVCAPITALDDEVFSHHYMPFVMRDPVRYVTFANHARRCVEVRICDEPSAIGLLQKVYEHENTRSSEQLAAIWGVVSCASWAGLESDDHIFAEPSESLVPIVVHST